MKKRLTTILLGTLLLNGGALQAQEFESATDAVKNMGVGWNLGNTLDANVQKISDPSSADYWGQQGLESETCWGQPVTKPELIKMMKEAGIGAIRVPVTWYNHMDKDGKVSLEWMNRVHEVVDYVIDQGLYCIVNVHHDTGADSGDANGKVTGAHWIHAYESNYADNQQRYEYLWQQIATEFKDYDEHLLFESYNEMLDSLYSYDSANKRTSWGSWCYASFNKQGTQYDATNAASSYKAINSYAQSFVNAVRATGGNNVQRNLIVNTYAACDGRDTWNSHLQDPLKEMNMPSDPANSAGGHIAFQIHCYPNISNLENTKKGIDYMITNLNTYLVAKGGPVIIGEWGSSNVDATVTDYDADRSKYLDFCKYFIEKTKANGIATFYWMGLSDGIYRSEPAFSQPDLAETLAKAYHGSAFEGKYPAHDTSKGTVVFEGEKTLDWGQAVMVSGSMLKEVGNNVEVELSYKLDFTDYDDIQFMYNNGGWQRIPDGLSMDGKAFDGADFSASGFYSIKSGDTKTSILTFDTSAFELVSAYDLVIQGHGVIVTKVVVKAPGTSGINNAVTYKASDSTIYNLSGQRVGNPQKGIYIRDGKKYIAK